MPAVGTTAARCNERRYRHVPFEGQLSEKPKRLVRSGSLSPRARHSEGRNAPVALMPAIARREVPMIIEWLQKQTAPRIAPGGGLV